MRSRIFNGFRSRILAAGSCLAVALGLAACEPAAPPEDAAATEAQVFEVRGRIASVPSDGKSLIIEHEEIPGYMAAMTMPFYLESEALAEGLNVGDTVRFRYVVEERSSWIDEIEKIDAQDLKLADSAPRASRRGLPIPRLEEGDEVPGFELINQSGDSFSLSDFRGKATVMTFIFTRCPVPDFCPRMSRRFQEIQKAATEDPELADRFQLVSLTIDPEFDTPEVLKAYAASYTEDHSSWTFATGPADRIEEITTRFSVFIDENSGEGAIDHALATALIGPDGKLIHIWRGNAWSTDEVLAAVRETLPQTTDQP